LKRRYVLTFFQKLPPCLVGIEACASSHHWSRELQALGHTVREHMAAPTNAAKREKSSCQPGAVHTWHMASFHRSSGMSGVGGRLEIARPWSKWRD
jgi:hypothetical protein